MSNVQHLADHAPRHFERFGTEYAEGQLPGVMWFFDNCGLAPEFSAILGRHIADLELVIEDPGTNGSQLILAAREVDGQRVWYRAALMSRNDLTKKKHALECVLEDMEIDEEASLNRPVLNWGFYELVGDALGNSVSMQKRYNKYIPDWNGQAYCYMGHQAVSEAIFEEYGSDSMRMTDEEHKKWRLNIAQDHRSFRSGVALELLKDDIVYYVTSKMKQANWVISALRKKYYEVQGVAPLTKHQIMARLAMLQPQAPKKDMDDFIDRYFDEPTLEDS